MDGPEIPSFFICPISLQLMKDPVTVSTGVSYDRTSIDRWLYVYDHNTCPVTNQPLTDPSLTPNSTLLRLILSWAAAEANRIKVQSTTAPKPKPAFDVSVVLRELVDAAREPHLQIKSLRKIKSLVQDDVDCRICMEEAGVTSLVASLITNTGLPEISDLNDNSAVVDEAMAVLHLLKPSRETLKRVSEEKNGELIILLSSILQRGAYRNRVHAALLLSSIFKVVDDIFKMELRTDLFGGAVEILKDQNSNRAVTMAVLSIVMEVMLYGRNRTKAVEAGVVAVLIELLVEMEREDRQRCEVMLRVLELLCRRAEGRSALLAHPAGMAAVSGKILRISHTATEKSVEILLLLCRFCEGGRVVEEMMEVGAVAKICMVVQVECSRKTREKAKEIMGMHLKAWNKFPCFPLNCLP